MNKITIIGNLTKDPVTRFAKQSGKTITNFTVAVDRYGSQGERTDFFRVCCFDKLAENCANFLRKGSKVWVCGSIHLEMLEDPQSGEKTGAMNITAGEVGFLTPAER